MDKLNIQSDILGSLAELNQARISGTAYPLEYFHLLEKNIGCRTIPDTEFPTEYYPVTTHI
jgi:hypothetical protein